MNTLLILLSLVMAPHYVAPKPQQDPDFSAALIHKAPQAKDTIQVQAYRYGYVPYPANSDWYGSLYDEQGRSWTFDIICDSTLEKGIFPTDGKQYVFSDMMAYWTFMLPYEYGPADHATDAKFKYWVGEDELEHIDACMKCESGKIYHITYVTKTVPETYVDRYDTLRVVRLGDYRDSVEHCFQFTATNDSIRAAFTIVSQTIPGSYTKEDILGELDGYTFLYINDIDRSACDFNVTIVQGEHQGEYKIDAEYYCYNGKCYHINMDYMLPQIRNVIDFECSDMQVTTETFYDVFISGYTLTASSEQYAITYSMGAPAGFVTSGMHLVNRQTGKTVDVYSDLIEVYNPLHAHAEALDYDGNYYIIEMRGTPPDTTEQREITVYDAQLDNKTKTDGYFLFEGFNPDSTYYFSLAIMSTQIEGTYDQDDADFNYTFVADYVVDTVYGSFFSNGYTMIALDAEVKKIGDHYEVDASILTETLSESVIRPLFSIHMTTASQSPTDLYNTGSLLCPNARKVLNNGRINIEKNGTKYDLFGSQLTN